MAIRGKILIIGAVSKYTSAGQMNEVWDDQLSTYTLLQKSVSVIGFFLNHYTKMFPQAWQKLRFVFEKSQISVGLDPKRFMGIEQTKDAVQHLIVRLILLNHFFYKLLVFTLILFFIHSRCNSRIHYYGGNNLFKHSNDTTFLLEKEWTKYW